MVIVGRAVAEASGGTFSACVGISSTVVVVVLVVVVVVVVVLVVLIAGFDMIRTPTRTCNEMVRDQIWTII